MSAGEQLRRLHGALVEAFTLEELDQLATLELGVTLEQVAGHDCTVEQAALALVRWARRQGAEMVGRLIAGAAAARPGHAGLQQLSLPVPPAATEGAKRGGAQGRTMDDFVPGVGNGEQRRLGEQIGRLAADVGHLQQDVAALRASVDRLLQRREPWTPGLWYVAVFLFGIALATGVFLVAFQ